MDDRLPSDLPGKKKHLFHSIYFFFVPEKGTWRFPTGPPPFARLLKSADVPKIIDINAARSPPTWSLFSLFSIPQTPTGRSASK